MTQPRDHFIELLRHDILELDAAALDFGLERVLDHRVLLKADAAHLDSLMHQAPVALPASIPVPATTP